MRTSLSLDSASIRWSSTDGRVECLAEDYIGAIKFDPAAPLNTTRVQMEAAFCLLPRGQEALRVRP